MSKEYLERVMRSLGAPALFSEVRVKCNACGKLHAFPAMEWMEAVADLAVAVNCPCGKLVGIVRKEDGVTFVGGASKMGRSTEEGLKRGRG